MATTQELIDQVRGYRKPRIDMLETQKRMEETEKCHKRLSATLTCCGNYCIAAGTGCALGVGSGIAAYFLHPIIGLFSAAIFCCAAVNGCCAIKHDDCCCCKNNEGVAQQQSRVVTTQPQNITTVTQLQSTTQQSNLKREYLNKPGDDFVVYKETSKTGKRNYVVERGSINLDVKGAGKGITIQVRMDYDGIIALTSYKKKAVDDSNREKMMSKVLKNKSEFRNVYTGGIILCQALKEGSWRLKS